jgi:hypothetical protein
MFLGLVMAGIAVGAIVAGMWIASGGSLLMGFVLYSLVATLVTLGMAALSYSLLSGGKSTKPARRKPKPTPLPSRPRLQKADP